MGGGDPSMGGRQFPADPYADYNGAGGVPTAPGGGYAGGAYGAVPESKQIMVGNVSWLYLLSCFGSVHSLRVRLALLIRTLASLRLDPLPTRSSLLSLPPSSFPPFFSFPYPSYPLLSFVPLSSLPQPPAPLVNLQRRPRRALRDHRRGRRRRDPL
jgi:hypothetical protein